MSGICGAIHPNAELSDRPSPDLVVRRMAEAARHRAPDGVHVRTGAGLALAHLAHHRLPEDARQKQPLVEDHLAVVASARLDNREELADTLATPPRHGSEPSDALLILAAYRRWGLACPEHLLGDFAFALWDARRHRLVAARDPIAMRPLYYHVEPGQRVLFASEVKQILAVPEVEARIFDPAVAAYLAGQFAPLAWTFYQGIHQLEPGHVLIADAGGHRTWRFGDVGPDRRIRYRDEREYADHFLHLFQEAVRCRLRTTQPVGVMLSGGMDSGSIASVAGHLIEHGRAACPAFHTYSWAFDGLPECDERHISDGIVEHYDLPATYLSTDDAYPLKDYPAHGPDRDAPYIGVYQPLLEHTMRRARQDEVGLMMSGDRGDLVIGEHIYDYLGLLGTGQWRTLLEELRLQGEWRDASLRAMARRFLGGPLRSMIWPAGRAEWLRQPLRQAYRRLRPPGRSYPAWVRDDFAERTSLAAIRHQNVVQANRRRRSVRGQARKERYAAITVPMHMRGAVSSERTHARFGQGFADPWSDTRLAEFALAVPQRVLNTTGREKRLVRQAMQGIMPEAVRQAVRKTSPYPLYMRALKEQARPTVLDLTSDMQAAARGYVDEQALRLHYEAICNGEPEHPFFWWALTLEMWLRQYWT